MPLISTKCRHDTLVHALPGRRELGEKLRPQILRQSNHNVHTEATLAERTLLWSNLNMGSKTIHIVWAAGKEAYHLQQCMKHYTEPKVLNAMAQELQRSGMSSTFTDAMRRAVEIVDYHRHLQNGATIARDTHDRLKRHDGPEGLPLPRTAPV